MLSRHHKISADAEAEARASWNPRELLFDEQYAVHTDPARLRLVDGSRRCGKSYWAAVELINTAITISGSRGLFLALTRDDARELVWEELRDLNERFALGGTLNEVRLEIEWPNGSRTRCGGAKDRRQAERRRGRFYDIVIIDECQLFPSHLRVLVESILKPALLGRGRQGRLVLMGTPAEVPGVGYWEQQVAAAIRFDPANDNGDSRRKWSKHQWTLRQNPWLGSKADVESFLAEMAEAAGGWDAPSFRREYLGERPPANDNDRPFVYDPKINDFAAYPGAKKQVLEHYERKEGRRWTSFTRWALPLGGNWVFVIGVDLGSRACSAICVLGMTDAAPGKIWLIEEFLSTRMLPDKLRDKIQERREAYVVDKVKTMVVDEGALGGMIADQWRAPPYLLPIGAADKVAPEVQADFLSASMARGDFFICPESRCAEDMAVAAWDEEYLEKRGKRRVAKEPHSDIIPAARYAFKDAYAISTSLRTPRPMPVTVDEKERAALEDELKESTRKRAKREFGKLGGGDAIKKLFGGLR